MCRVKAFSGEWQGQRGGQTRRLLTLSCVGWQYWRVPCRQTLGWALVQWTGLQSWQLRDRMKSNCQSNNYPPDISSSCGNATLSQLALRYENTTQQALNDAPGQANQATNTWQTTERLAMTHEMERMWSQLGLVAAITATKLEPRHPNRKYCSVNRTEESIKAKGSVSLCQSHPVR